MPLLRSLDLFSGIGGITRALHGLAEPVAYCDWAPDSRRVLRERMSSGALPRAPVSADVRELGAVWLKANNKAMPDIIVGGFPCVGFSALGKPRGFEEKQSGLFSEILRLADETKCPMLFLENVPNVIKLGMHDVGHELSTKRGYELRWCVVGADTMGAPHKRMRWFCLAVRPGFAHRWERATAYEPHPWTARTPPRAVPASSHETRASMALLGNSVVPDAVRYAFLYLLSGAVSVPAKLSTPAGTRLTPALPKRAGSRPRSREHWPRCGTLGAGPGGLLVAHQPPPRFRKPPGTRLVFDPTLFKTSKPPSVLLSSPRLTGPVGSSKWATPRHGCTGSSNYITERTVRDLPTQVRFEAKTVDRNRGGGVNPEFVEWLMGYPAGWTRAGADVRTATGSV